MLNDGEKKHIFKKSFRLILELALLITLIIIASICIFEKNMDCPILYFIIIAITLLLGIFAFEVLCYIRKIERYFSINIRDNPSVIKKLKEIR